jgi:LPS-assembly lipoprotein
MRALAVLGLLGALVGVLGAAGCGFTPMYAHGGAGGTLSRIAVSTPDNRLGYGLREQLEDALAWDRGVQPALYRLNVEVEQDRRPLGRRIDDTSVRYELTVRGAWTLTPTTGGTPLTGVETTAVTYAAADQPYAGIAAQQDGEDRAVAELSRRLRLAILTALAE